MLESGTKNHGNNSIRSFVVHIIMNLVPITIVLNVEKREDFGKTKLGQ